MSIFIGTLIIVLACCLALGLGGIMGGKPLSGGCGRNPDNPARCASCPNRKTTGDD